jgi:N-acetylglucosaminyldiphosphoundecaprenol N-acetyl-beta-D-mannosaminyltransferase
MTAQRPASPAPAGRFPATKVDILGVPVHRLTTAGALAQIQEFMKEPGLHQLATVNPEFVMTAQKDPDFMAVLRQADLCLADGVGLVWASHWLGQGLPERVAGADLVYVLARLAAHHGWRLFLLGAGPGVAEQAAEIFLEQCPGLTIAGTFAGSPDPAENETIVNRINESRADLLFVAYGAPGQDKWIARNRHRLKTVKVAIGVGGALDFVTGRAVRAPRWVQRLGLEWLHRLIHEPWRWRRMLALPSFAGRLLLTSPPGSARVKAE